MEDEETKQMDTVLPEHETLLPEDEGLAPAPPKQTSEPSANAPDLDRARLENDVYQRHFAAISEEIAEIRRQYQVAEPAPPDPVTVLFEQVNGLKMGFDEIKNMIAESQQREHEKPIQQTPQPPPIQQIQPMFPAPPWNPYPITPMYQTSTIMPAPQLTYFSTPTLAPTNTHAPQFSQFMNSNTSTGGK